MATSLTIRSGNCQSKWNIPLRGKRKQAALGCNCMSQQPYPWDRDVPAVSSLLGPGWGRRCLWLPTSRPQNREAREGEPPCWDCLQLQQHLVLLHECMRACLGVSFNETSLLGADPKICTCRCTSVFYPVLGHFFPLLAFLPPIHFLHFSCQEIPCQLSIDHHTTLTAHCRSSK